MLEGTLYAGAKRRQKVAPGVSPGIRLPMRLEPRRGDTKTNLSPASAGSYF
jgi:hypothetical protein